MKLKPAFMRPAHLLVADDLSKHIKGFMNGIFLGVPFALVGTLIWRFVF